MWVNWVNWTVRCEALLDTGDDFHGVGVQLAPNNLRRDVVEAREKSPCAARLRQTYLFEADVENVLEVGRVFRADRIHNANQRAPREGNIPVASVGFCG